MEQQEPLDYIGPAIPLIPMGALRILSRRDDAEVLFLHGEDRDLEDGERLAHITWWPSIAIAEAISNECSRLLIVSRFKSRDGWYDFGVEHIDTLVQAAKAHLNVTFFPREERVPAKRQAWTHERAAWLGFLVGRGNTAKAIADDPLIASTPNNVHQRAKNFGLRFRDVPRGQTILRLPRDTEAAIDRLAASAQMTREAYLRRWIITAMSNPGRSSFERAS